jgi:hypothetical protein
MPAAPQIAPVAVPAPTVTTPVSVPSLPVTQASIMPIRSIASTAVPMVAPAGNSIMGQSMYQWLAGNSINPFQ